ncbi:MAG: YgjV family protein [Acholeplasmataceae bacterium]
MIDIVDIIGYVASTVVLISLLMSSVIKLRVINLIGSAVFATYGFLILSYPTALMNLGIVVINLYYLIKLNNAKEHFEMIELDKDSKLYLDFISQFKDDIASFMNVDFDFNDQALTKYFITRNTVPAGLFIGKIKGDAFEITLDYTTPMYRDYKAGKYVYNDQKDLFKSLGVNTFISAPGAIKHETYLEKMGFEKVTKGQDFIMEKRIEKQS